jgi:dTMP kinase
MPFITFEGVEGSGKSTQLSLTAARVRETGRSVLETREPGGTGIGEQIRRILLDPAHTDLEPLAEWLLYEADRGQHVREVLRPALERGAIVLCDRYSDTTEAYQQVGRGIDPESVRRVDALARDGLLPDLTLLYDLNPEEGLSRARERDGGRLGRFEATEIAFHRRVRAAYLEIARREPERVALISARGGAVEVFGETWRILAERLAL